MSETRPALRICVGSCDCWASARMRTSLKRLPANQKRQDLDPPLKWTTWRNFDVWNDELFDVKFILTMRFETTYCNIRRWNYDYFEFWRYFSFWKSINVGKYHLWFGKPSPLGVLASFPTFFSFHLLSACAPRNGCFLDSQQLLDDCGRIAHIPCTILHGRNDLICPPINAWTLRKSLPLAKLKVVPMAGHSSSLAPALKSAILEAIDSYR